MIISNDRRFIFIHIPKTGGESITETLSPYIPPTEIILNVIQPNEIVRYKDSDSQILRKHSSALDVMDTVSADVWDSYFKFAFVRHPIDRAISFYGYCSKFGQPPQRTLRQRVRRPYRATTVGKYHRFPKMKSVGEFPAMKAFRESNSFSEFIRHPELGMKLQTSWICDHHEQIIVDHVGRFEHFGSEMAAIQLRLGVPLDIPAKKNVSGGNGVARSQLTQDDITFLARRFEPDFALLGYVP